MKSSDNSPAVNPSTLYIVSTPIGNLEDITYRAINILNNVDIIACEDTRHSLKLLNHYHIKKKLITYHSYNKKNSTKGILQLLKQGKSIALISDSGTPCISDPGFILVNECYKEQLQVVSIPGPSAFLTLLTSSGFRSDHFCFHGFLSPKSGKRKNKLKEISLIEGTHILYESPYRLLKLIEDIIEIFPEKLVCLGKELTKMNETIIIDHPVMIKKQVINFTIKGEFVILIANYLKK